MPVSAKDKKGWLMIGGGIAVVAGIMAIGQIYKAPARNNIGCTSAVSSGTVILLDHSEGIPEQTAREIRRRVLDFITNKVPTEAHISMYAVSDSSSRALIPLFERCKPPSKGNRLTESERALEYRFQHDFMAKLEAAVSEKFDDSRSSPIAQAISDISVSDDLRHPNASLLVFSDLIENSPSLDMYHCAGDPRAAYRAHNQGALERPSFNNVHIELNVIPRRDLGKETLQCRNLFWNWFLGDNKGQSAGVEPQYLPG